MPKGKKEKIEINCPEDIRKLPQEEQMKWELAVELGLFEKVLQSGWKSLTARESGRIGGILSSRQKQQKQNSKH